MEKQAAEDSTAHFMIVSSAAKPSPEEIADYLEQTWKTFRDLFGVEPAPVKVVIAMTSGTNVSSSQADQQRRDTPHAQGGTVQHSIAQIAWTIKEGEPLSSQSFSDLSHEIAHIYFIDYMEDKGGLHQSHAWLHEAVACYHERDPFRKNREQWIKEHLKDRIPLGLLFTMKNPVKENPLVELTVKLHEKLARGEIKVEEVNRRISEYASSHAGELAQAGIRNMTYYSQSLSLFEFLLKTEGRPFIRQMAQDLKKGKSLDEMIRGLPSYPNGIPQLEQAWIKWVEKS